MMEKLFDIKKFDSYKEDNRREVKKANGGLPIALWDTYSSFANTYGGVIILGIKELDDKSWKTTGLKSADKEKLLDNFWNLIHNSQKVNINLLSENDVEVYEVGVSDPRNKTLMKMFNLINIGERAGSGVPNIFDVWEDEGWVEPAIEEYFDPDRIILTLEFKKKQAKKATEKSDRKKATEKSDRKKVTKNTQVQYEQILTFMKLDTWYKASDLVEVLDVKETRTKELLRALVADGKILDNGATKGRCYKKL